MDKLFVYRGQPVNWQSDAKNAKRLYSYTACSLPPTPTPPHHVREFWILGSGFHAMDSGFQVLDSILFQCNLDSGFHRQWDSGFQSTGYRITQSKFSQIADSTIGSFSKRIRRRQRERQKSNRFRLAKQLHCTCIPLFCTFLCRHCTNKT